MAYSCKEEAYIPSVRPIRLDNLHALLSNLLVVPRTPTHSAARKSFKSFIGLADLYDYSFRLILYQRKLGTIMHLFNAVVYYWSRQFGIRILK